MSRDGRTVLVGATDENHKRGAAWIYSRIGSRWAPEAQLLQPAAAAGDLFGSAVALSGDGRTALVASVGYHHNDGVVWVYRRTGPGWKLAAKLTPRDERGHSEFGWDIALSADGATALIGGPVDAKPNGYRGNLGAGAAWIFHRTGNTWAQQGPKITGLGDDATAVFGSAVALSGDGTTALVGAGYAHTGRGIAWVFVQTQAGWKQQGKGLYPRDANGLPQFGTAVVLSDNGHTALISGPADDNDRGAVWTFTRTRGPWVQRGPKLVIRASTPVDFGGSVALSSDGTTMLVGGLNSLSDRGRAWVYTRAPQHSWRQEGAQIVPAGPGTAHALFGEMTAISADGRTLVITAPGYNGRHGAVWIYG